MSEKPWNLRGEHFVICDICKGTGMDTLTAKLCWNCEGTGLLDPLEDPCEPRESECREDKGA